MDSRDLPLVFNQTVKVDTRCFVIGGSWGGGVVYDKPIIEFFYNKARVIKEPVIFDIGANTGSFCMLAKFLEKSKVYAFEPQKEIYDLLMSNIAINGFNNLYAYNIALSNTTGKSHMSIPAVNNASGLGTLSLNPLRFSAKRILNISCDTIDNFCKSNSIDKLDLIKIDTEGHEYNVLLGGMETIKRFRPQILMEFNGDNMKQCGVTAEQITTLLEKINYQYSVSGSEDIFCEYKK